MRGCSDHCGKAECIDVLGGRPRFRVAKRANPWPWLSIASNGLIPNRLPIRYAALSR